MATTTGSAPYRVAVVDRDLDDEGLADWWDGLPQPRAYPALRWAFLRTWARAFMPAQGRWSVHVALLDDRPVAAVPLYRVGGALHAPANDHSDVFDLAHEPDHRAAAAPLAAAMLRRRADLQRLPGDSPLLAAIRDLDPPMLIDSDESPCLTLPGTADALLADRSSRFRANVRKAGRTLAALGDLELRDVVGGSAAAAAAFAAMCDVEAHGWKGRQGDAIDSRPQTRRFYRELALDGSAGRWVRLATLRLAGRVVAAQLDLEDGGRRAGLRTSFVDDLPGRQSPGLVLLWWVLRDEIARGLHTHDFGGGPDAWKRHWTDAGSERVTLRSRPNTTAGRLTHSARERVKPVVRPLLRRSAGGR